MKWTLLLILLLTSLLPAQGRQHGDRPRPDDQRPAPGRDHQERERPRGDRPDLPPPRPGRAQGPRRGRGEPGAGRARDRALRGRQLHRQRPLDGGRPGPGRLGRVAPGEGPVADGLRERLLRARIRFLEQRLQQLRHRPDAVGPPRRGAGAGPTPRRAAPPERA
jgi:hypothetical protein